MRFDTKIAVALRDDLSMWQKLNATAFMISGIAGTAEGVVGEDYIDASGTAYLPMFRQPVLIFSATGDELRAASPVTRVPGGPCVAISDRHLYRRTLRHRP